MLLLLFNVCSHFTYNKYTRIIIQNALDNNCDIEKKV